MANLKITFEQMFLLVRSESRPVVLLPKGSGKMIHDLFVDRITPQLKICNANISIIAGDDTPARSMTPVEWPHPGYLLDTSNLVGPNDRRPTVKRPLLEGDACPAELNARLYLPPGQFGWKWNMSPFGEARWQVGPKKHNHQLLTDVMTFECDIEDSGIHSLAIQVRETPDSSLITHKIPLQEKPGDNINLVFWQHDRREHATLVPFLQRTRQLSDFAVVFALLDSEASLKVPEFYRMGPETSRPPGSRIPRKINAKALKRLGCGGDRDGDEPDILSDTDPERPICGGAQGCPP